MSEENTQDQVLFTIADRDYTSEDAAKKIENADGHISNLEAENQDLRHKIDEYMGALANSATGITEKSTQESVEDTPQAVTSEDVARIVAETIKSQSVEDRLTSNAKIVEDQLTDVFGTPQAAKEALVNKTKELGWSDATVKQLVTESPGIIVDLIAGRNAPPVTEEPTTTVGTRNSQAIVGNNTAPSEGTYKWWQELRKTDPKGYDSPRMAMQRMKDAQENPEKFFGN